MSQKKGAKGPAHRAKVTHEKYYMKDGIWEDGRIPFGARKLGLKRHEVYISGRPRA